MRKCPCEECIVYAMCINKETAGCELTDEYVGKKPYKAKNHARIEETRDFLKKDVAVGTLDYSIRFSNVIWVPGTSRRCAK